MFEAFVTLCIVSMPDVCRDVSLPAFSSADQQTCEQSLSNGVPDWLLGIGGTLDVQAQWCGPAPQTGLAFIEVAPGLYVHRGQISDAAPENAGDVANIGFVIGENSIAVIDSGGSRRTGEGVYHAIRAISDLPISHLILTHMHPDHVLGAAVFREAGAQVVGHASLSRALSDRRDSYLGGFGRLIGDVGFLGTNVILPDVEVSDQLDIDLGQRVLHLKVWPQSHTSTDLTVLDVTSDVLFTGDLVFAEHIPAIDGSLTGWQSVMADLIALPTKRIVPGHGGPILPWPAAALAQQQYFEVLARDTRAAIEAGATLGEAAMTIGQSEVGNWQLFELFNARNATVAYTELEWE